MSLRLKTFITCLGLLALFLTGLTGVWAHPLEELTPDQSLYQRVKKLGDYGLLDPEDKAVLDAGKIVTRMELAFYTEKAKAKIETPQYKAQPTLPSPTPQPLPTPMMILPLPVVNSQIRNEIDELLKELKNDAADLKTEWSQEDQRIKNQQSAIDALSGIQDQLGENFKNANNKITSPNFDSIARFRYEEISITGSNGPLSTIHGVSEVNLPTANAIRAVNEEDIKMTTDFGGVGSFTLGLAGVLSDSNASASGSPSAYSAPASLFVFNPDLAVLLDGPLGQWNTHVMVEGYPGALTFGDFTRGIGPTSLKLYQDPFDIKKASDDKDSKIWDDYMTNIGVVQSNYASGQIESTYDLPFDGVFGVGNNLPLIGGDTRLVLMLGRMGTTNLQTQRWEEGAKLDSTLLPNLRGDISTEWVNDNDATTNGPELNLKSYQTSLNWVWNSVNVNLEAGFSSLYTGYHDAGSPSNPDGIPTNTALEAPAGQVAITYYPLGFFYDAISDGFAAFQSKVGMAGVHFDQYGLASSPSSAMDAYGRIGEADNLSSDRYGWRVNFGWNGRQQDWMKKWPSFLDAIVVNFNVSQKGEYTAETDNMGYNVVEAVNMISLYYPDDEGLWGLNFWGGYGSGPPWYPVRQDYIDNIQALRNDGDVAGDDVRYQYTISSERVPLIMPLNPVTHLPYPAGSAPATIFQVNGYNQYYDIPDLKTYNYITLTTKIQFNKLLGFSAPFDGSFFFTDNNVAGHATATLPTNAPANGATLFDQTVYDVSGMIQVFRNVNLIGDCGVELWNSMYTYPLINYRTDSIGAGFAYDMPWGGGKLEFRYKHLTFKDQYVPLNDYQADQVFSTLSFLF